MPLHLVHLVYDKQQTINISYLSGKLRCIYLSTLRHNAILYTYSLIINNEYNASIYSIFRAHVIYYHVIFCKSGLIVFHISHVLDHLQISIYRHQIMLKIWHLCSPTNESSFLVNQKGLVTVTRS